MYYEYWQANNGQWYWHLKAANHETLAAGEGYVHKQDCLIAIGALMDTTRQTPLRERK